MLKRLIGIVKDEEGATIIEYVLLVALIAVAAVGAITTLGNEVTNKFTTVGNSLK